MRFDQVVSSVLTLSAIAIAGSVVYRSVLAPPGSAATTTAAPTLVKEWQEITTYGMRSGKENALVTIVELEDLECPACRLYHRTIASLLEKYPDDVAKVYVSFPLEMHRYAVQAALAAECADSVRRFSEFVDVLYEKQDSIGVKSWGAFAVDAGIADSARISACAAQTGESARIKAGKDFGRKIGATGTPTILVNGWHFSTPPSREKLDSIVVALKRGESPFPKR